MPLISNSTFIRNSYFAGKHLQTIIPGIYRKTTPVLYKRERISTPDNDFLDLDWSSLNPNNENLVIISHGLEGNSQRPYVLAMVNSFNKAGWDALAWNFRSCSGELNKQIRFYHSGETNDLELVVQYCIGKDKYKKIALIGFSLGGNITLKYLGENKPNTNIIKYAATFSVPLHLSSASKAFNIKSNYIYQKNFLKKLIQKVKEKSKKYPDEMQIELLKNIKNLNDFDEYFTSRIHGFQNAEDYYEKSSSLFFLHNIKIPTLIVNSANDPFLSNECFPMNIIEDLKNVFLEIPKEGGHCGFSKSFFDKDYWPGNRALFFFNEL